MHMEAVEPYLSNTVFFYSSQRSIVGNLQQCTDFHLHSFRRIYPLSMTTDANPTKRPPPTTDDFDIMHGSKKITMVKNTKFLGLTLDSTLSWKPHIDTISTKLSSAGFALRLLRPLLSLESLRMEYFSYFHSIMTYGIIFWGNSRRSSVIFRLQ